MRWSAVHMWCPPQLPAPHIESQPILQTHIFLDRLLVLLRHKFRRVAARRRGVWQQGHRSSVLARAMARRRLRVAIEFGMWRSGRTGSASGSVTVGKGRFLELRGGAWS